MTAKNELVKLMESLGRYSDEALEKLEKYMEGILSWNGHVNLTNITYPDDFINKHYIDSLLLGQCQEFLEGKRIIDVGTGGGFPGIPLAILYPEKEFVLLDSLKKRLKIIDELCQEIKISNVTTYHGRAEDAGKEKSMRESFDVCVSRAVANLSTLCELCIPLVKKGGNFIAYKGPAVNDELKEAKKAIKILGGKITRVEFPMGQKDLEHAFAIIEKIADTPGKYPRKAGDPSKKPIR